MRSWLSRTILTWRQQSGIGSEGLRGFNVSSGRRISSITVCGPRRSARRSGGISGGTQSPKDCAQQKTSGSGGADQRPKSLKVEHVDLRVHGLPATDWAGRRARRGKVSAFPTMLSRGRYLMTKICPQAIGDESALRSTRSTFKSSPAAGAVGEGGGEGQDAHDRSGGRGLGDGGDGREQERLLCAE